MASVSIVMTTYSVEGFVLEAVGSALGQTHSDVHLVVVDDGSTDETRSRVEALADARIELVDGPGRGQAAALNLGLDHARGELVAFLDGDDIWARDHLALQVDALLRHPECPMTFSLSRVVDVDGNDLGPISRPPRGPVGRAELFVENFCANGSSTVLRRAVVERVGRFDETFPACFDVDYWLRVAGEGPVRCVPRPLTFYRRRPGQLSSSRERMETGWRLLLEKWRALEPELVASRGNEASSNMYRYLAALAVERGDVRGGIACLSRAAREAPRVFATDSRNYWVGAAIASRALLPDSSTRRPSAARGGRAPPDPGAASRSARRGDVGVHR